MKKILFATDRSTCAEQAAWFLAHLPHDEKLELTVLSVLVPPHTHKAVLRQDWIEMCIEQDRVLAAETFANIQEQFEGANASLQHIVEVGHPGTAIVERAEALNSDLLVLGARGRSAVARILLGSTSDFVATHARCSVLIVRPTGLPETRHPLRIAMGYEDTGPARAAIEEVAEIDWGKEVDFRLVSVCTFAEGYDATMIADVKRAAQRAAAQLRDVAPRIETHLIEHDHIGEGLVKYAEDHLCDLMIVGETPRGFVNRILMGSTSRYVLRHAPCSVWITRNRIRTELATTGRASAAAVPATPF